MKTGISTATLAILFGSLFWVGLANADSSAPAETPEFRLVMNFISASGDDVGTPQGRELYQDQVQASLQEYAANHSADPNLAMTNLMDSFHTLGLAGQTVDAIQALSARYARIFQSNSTMTPTQVQSVWRQYGTDLASAMRSIPNPQGAQFSSCQWAVTLMVSGFAVGIPLLTITVAKGMGDQNVSEWIGAPGALGTLLGIGSMIATIPTCL